MRITPEKAARWRNRYLDGGIDALGKDESRPGSSRTVTDARTAEVIHKTTQEKPVNATHWSTCTMAAATGLSETTVRRIWHANGLKPHLVKTFKVSNDTRFAEKLEAIVGLYLNPPEHAIVLCAGEKSQIQALDRMQPGLPIKKGMCDNRHRHQEWLKFLRVIDQVIPPEKDLHLIVDNYAASFTILKN